MHVIQYVATQADSAEEAHTHVQEYLEAQLGREYEETNTWYDWFIAGGGRWSSSPNPYNSNYAGDVAHQDDPRFHEYLIKAHEYHLLELGRALDQSREIDLPQILDNIENNKEGLDPDYLSSIQLYPLTKLANIAGANWGHHSFFFDIINEITYPSVVRDSIESGVDNWYIVPVDFHH